MFARTLFLAAATAAAACAPARAQVTIRSLGDNPVTVQRGEGGGVVVRGGAGSVLHVGHTTIVSGGGELNIVGAPAPVDVSQFLRDEDGGAEDGFVGLSVNMRVSIPSDPAATEAQRIQAMTRMIEGLNEAMAGQCKLSEASFGTKCRVDKVSFSGRLNQSAEARRAGSADVRSQFALTPPTPAKREAPSP